MNDAPTPPDPFGRSGPTPAASTFARAMTLSGIVFIIGGIVAGIAINPVLFVVAAVGAADLVIAQLVKSGKIRIAG